MAQTHQLTAIIEREGDGYVALCPELDIASQGDTIEEARRNLTEALEAFFECADPSEVQDRLHDEEFVTHPKSPLACPVPGTQQLRNLGT